MVIDTEAVRRQHPLADVVAAYGIDLRRSGGALVGRCPFHADGGRPNLTVYSRSGRWVCYRCGERGDVIGFVQQLEHLGFRDAVARLGGVWAERSTYRPHSRPVRPVRTRRPHLGPEELEALAAAVELYANRLLTEERALDYLAGRGFQRPLLERYRVGYAAAASWSPTFAGAACRWRRRCEPACSTVTGARSCAAASWCPSCARDGLCG